MEWSFQNALLVFDSQEQELFRNLTYALIQNHDCTTPLYTGSIFCCYSTCHWNDHISYSTSSLSNKSGSRSTSRGLASSCSTSCNSHRCCYASGCTTFSWSNACSDSLSKLHEKCCYKNQLWSEVWSMDFVHCPVLFWMLIMLLDSVCDGQHEDYNPQMSELQQCSGCVQTLKRIWLLWVIYAHYSILMLYIDT